MNGLEKENYLQSCDTEEMADRLAYYLSEINALHPFREGNGRTQRLFIEILAERAGYEVDFSEVSAEEMVEASAKAFLRDHGKMNELMRRIVKKIRITASTNVEVVIMMRNCGFEGKCGS